jgi:hypothetical protein
MVDFAMNRPVPQGERSMAPNLGRMGESVLNKWAAEIGVIANTCPLDHIATPLKCVIQVKSTGRNIRRRQVPLSNWLYLIRNPLPAFFLVLRFGPDNTCESAHLVHIGRDYIDRTQRRLRLVSANGPRGGALNQTEQQFSWCDRDLVSPLDGAKHHNGDREIRHLELDWS